MQPDVKESQDEYVISLSKTDAKSIDDKPYDLEFAETLSQLIVALNEAHNVFYHIYKHGVNRSYIRYSMLNLLHELIYQLEADEIVDEFFDTKNYIVKSRSPILEYVKGGKKSAIFSFKFDEIEEKIKP